MAAFKKASSEIAEFLQEALAPYNCRPRKMFGSPVWFVNNNMFCGVHEDSLFFRFSPTDRDQLVAEQDEIVQFEPLAGRKMSEYLVLPDHLCNDPAFFAQWLERSFGFVSSLPLKEPKPRLRFRSSKRIRRSPWLT